MEANRLLKEQGFLDGNPSAYRLTSKGKEFGVQRSHGNGLNGTYNVDWDSTHFDPRILDVLDSSREKLTKVRADISAEKQARKAVREVEQAEAEANFLAAEADRNRAETKDEIDPKKLMIAIGGVLVIFGATIGVRRGIEWYKRKKAEKAAQEDSGDDPDTSTGVEGK